MEVEIEVEIDDGLLAAAREYSGLTDAAAIVQLALNELLERETRRRIRRGFEATEP